MSVTQLETVQWEVKDRVATVTANIDCIVIGTRNYFHFFSCFLKSLFICYGLQNSAGAALYWINQLSQLNNWVSSKCQV